MKTRLILALSLALLARLHSAPVTLEMTLDTERHATAVVSGNFIETKFPAEDFGTTKFDWSGGYFRAVSLEFAKIGTNWNVWGSINVEFYYTAADVFVATVYDLVLRGQHKVAPDPGEATSGLEMLVYHDNLGGGTPSVDRVPSIDTWDSYPHLAGSHGDTMSLLVADLNGKTVAGVFGPTQNFAARVELYHVPDSGSTLLWWSVGCAGVVGLSRLRRYRR